MKRRALRDGCAIAVAVVAWAMASQAALGDDTVCRGHQLLSAPRPASSCRNEKPAVYKTPSGELTAYVVPVNPSLNATPDMESRIEIRTRDGRVLATQDHASPKGANGYYVVQAQWTSDQQFFVFSLASSGGHSPWQSPIEVFSRERKAFFKFSDMIQGNPTLTKRFVLKDANTVFATTWTNQNLEKPRTVVVNLKDAIASLPKGK